MTTSDDKTRWVLAYVLFGVSEVVAVVYAYKSSGDNAFGLAYGLPLLALLPIVSARTTLTAFQRYATLQNEPVLRLDVSLRLWTLVVISYTLFVCALGVNLSK